ncbi:MAG: peptidylprolyl isomerase [Acidobacteria bacterium]|nr:peptidylprolyl isomerase [Acidobacteriota bacterium]
MTRDARARPLAAAVAVAAALAGACVVSFPGAEDPKGTYEERIEDFARILAMEDARLYDAGFASRATRSPDPWMRAKMALALGRLKDPEANIYFPVLLKDDDPAVRRAAAFGAGVSGDARLVRLLVPVMSDLDPKTADAAAEALGKLGGDEATRALLGIAGSSAEAPPRAAAARALWRGSALTPSLVVPVLGPLAGREAAASSGRSLRREAVFALARKPVPEAAPFLRAALSSADARLVATAVRGLGVLGATDAASEISGLAMGPDSSVVIQSLLSLERIAAKGELPSSARTAALARATDGRPGVRVSALRLLGRFPNDEEVRFTLEGAIREQGWASQAALVSLVRSNPAKGLERCLEKVRGESLDLKLGAAEALPLVPEPGRTQLARVLLADPLPRVRAAALAAGDSLSNELLAVGLADRDAAVRAAAVEAGAASRSKAESGPFSKAWDTAFEALLRETEADYTVTALEAAASLGTKGRDLVARYTDAPDAVVRERARKLLVEKYAVPAASFKRIPVKSIFGPRDYAQMARDANESTFAAELVTAKGAVLIDLLYEDAPMTVENFRRLAAKGLFDGITIHRVVPDFVVQAGDPRGDGTGGPGYAIRDEINPNSYERGTVGMALSGPDTGGSQWFITLAPQPHLDGNYTVFGRVSAYIERADVIEQNDRLENVSVEVSPRGKRP